MLSLSRSPKSDARSAKWTPHENTPQEYSSAAKQYLVEKPFVKADSSPFKLSKHLLKHMAESRVLKEISKYLLLGIREAANCLLLVSRRQPPSIVFPPFCRVDENSVGLTELLETFFSAGIIRVSIRVMFES
jgi:hypothetical protein